MPRGFAAVSATFVSDDDGWVLGTAPCAKPPCTSVLRTRDGGVTWVGIPAPRAGLDNGTDTPGSIGQIRFADPLNGFADGDGLWVTHDGGASWRRQATVAGIPDAVVTDIAASSAGVYAIASGTDTRGGTDSHYRLVRADASSAQFSVVADLGTNTSVGSLVTSGGTVYLLTGPLTSLTRLVRVHGTSVTRMPLPAQGCGEVAASTSTALLLECGDGAAAGAMGERHLYGSTDSGSTFTRLPDPGAGAGYDNGGVADAGGGHAVLATTSSQRGALLTTSDGARHWRTTLSLSRALLTDLGFEDGTHGIVIATIGVSGNSGTQASGQLYRTTDSGSTWTRITF